MKKIRVENFSCGVEEKSRDQGRKEQMEFNTTCDTKKKIFFFLPSTTAEGDEGDKLWLATAKTSSVWRRGHCTKRGEQNFCCRSKMLEND